MVDVGMRLPEFVFLMLALISIAVALVMISLRIKELQPQAESLAYASNKMICYRRDK